MLLMSVVMLACAIFARASVANAAPATPAADIVAQTLAFDKWRGLSFGTYLSPKADFVASDGGVDVVFHFHAGQMAERQMKESGVNAVFVSCGYGIGSGAYADALANPARFGRMLDELVKNLETQTGKSGVHVRHLALASWSAGFAAVSKILAVDRYYAMVDTVILNDSLHSQYKDPNPKTPAQGADRVDVKMMRTFVRFAKDAAAGKKTMAITHSSIIPPDYASSAEATQALLTAIEVPSTVIDPDASDAQPASPSWRSMTMTKRADAGNLHVRGFRGRGPKDHFEHLYLIGEVLRSWVAPRWKREDRLVYTLAGEQL
ncbi:MAG: uncharacterized protein JWO86_8867 [Myxococcaceae bacterium]|nr:uncharacterized protein [Myxococcaceae bacterium]